MANKETAEQRRNRQQQEFNQFHEEAPLAMLQLAARAQAVGQDVKFTAADPANPLIVTMTVAGVFGEPSDPYEEKESFTLYQSSPYEFDAVETLVKRREEYVAEEQRQVELRRSAKAKIEAAGLTDEERKAFFGNKR